MGGGAFKTFWKVRLPHALPSLFGELKVAVTLAVIGAVVGEFVGASSGLGYVLIVASGNLNTALVFASIVLMSLVGIVLFVVVEVVERVTIPWQRAARIDQMVAVGTA